MEKRRYYSEIIEIWEKFCSQNDLEISQHRKSEISNGGATKALFIEAIDRTKNYKIFQTFYQADSWLEYIEAPCKLNCIYESQVGQDIELSIWGKDFMERIFRRNRIESGNSEFDSTFSGYSNDKEFMNKVFKDFEIQNILLRERMLLLNVTTENKIIRISLKNMYETYYSLEELKENFKIFKLIVERIMKSIKINVC